MRTSPCFDMLAGNLGRGFGQALHATEQQGFALALCAARDAWLQPADIAAGRP
jgi:hypothetical protein